MKDVDQLLKKVSHFERQAELESRAWVQVAIGIAMLLAPFVSEMVDQVKATEAISADVDKVLSNLTEYKKSYGFDKYDAQFTEFMSACQMLKDSMNAITKGADPANPETFTNLQKFMESSGKVEQLGYAIKGYLDEMKGAGGKVFDVLKKFKMNLGIDTAATAAGDAVDALYKHIAMTRPKLEVTYKELSEKYKAAASGAAPASVGGAQKQKAPASGSLEELADISF